MARVTLALLTLFFVTQLTNWAIFWHRQAEMGGVVYNVVAGLLLTALAIAALVRKL